jgi:hypothetical protein
MTRKTIGRVAQFFRLLDEAYEPDDLIAIAGLISDMSAAERLRAVKELRKRRVQLLELDMIKKYLKEAGVPGITK